MCEDILNIREIYLYETAEEATFKCGVFLRHVVANTFGAVFVVLTCRSQYVFARALRGARTWFAPAVCVIVGAITHDSPAVISLFVLSLVLCCSKAWDFAYLSDRELRKASSVDGDHFAKLAHSIDVFRAWHHRPPDEIMLCEMELCAMYAGVDLAETWLVMRLQDESVEEDDYFSETPQAILAKFLEVLSDVPWAVALYPSFEHSSSARWVGDFESGPHAVPVGEYNTRKSAVVFSVDVDDSANETRK